MKYESLNDLNHSIVEGRIVTRPANILGQNGQTVILFTLRCVSRVTATGQEFWQRVAFFRVKAEWSVADRITGTLHKHDRVRVMGAIRPGRYTHDRKRQNEYPKVWLQAMRIDLIEFASQVRKREAMEQTKPPVAAKGSADEFYEGESQEPF